MAENTSINAEIVLTETPITCKEASKYANMTERRLYAVKESGMLAGASTGAFTTKESLDHYLQNRNLNKIHDKQRIEEILSNSANFQQLQEEEKKLKNRQLEIDILKKEGELIALSEVKEFYFTHCGNANSLLADMTNVCTALIYELVLATENRQELSGSIKKIISEQTHNVRLALSDGLSKLEELEKKSNEQ